MADLETTQSKLRSTPTAGVAGEHSAYYRRLLSAGYKGYIQGSIGGGTLYGLIGSGIGLLAGVALLPITMGQSLWLIPILGGGFSLYGAHTFADIGKTAAIIADSADINEKRRYLLDRYYETPNDQEAGEIKRQLEEEHAPRKVETPFHWRPALVGAGIGILLAVTTVALMSAGIPALHFMEPALHFLLEGFGLHVAGGALAAGETGLAASIGVPGAVAALGAVGATLGGLAGSIIGIDREYIRSWLDKAEFAVHDPVNSERELAARERDIERLTEAARRGEALASRSEQRTDKIQVQEKQHPTIGLETSKQRVDPISPGTIAGLPERPTHQVREAQHAERIMSPVQALAQSGL